MLRDPLTNFEMQKYCQNDLNLMVFGNNLPKIMNRAYVTNLDEFKSIGTHCIALYVNAENRAYFDSFGVEHIRNKIRKVIGNKNVKTNIYRIQAYDSIMYGYFCIGLIIEGKSLSEYINLFSPNDYEKNDKIILKYFQ